MTDEQASELVRCPLCGEGKGYMLNEGGTCRWWDVHCAECGERIAECSSDRRTHIGGILPDRWAYADQAWSEAGAHAESLRVEIERLRDQLERATAAFEREQARADAAEVRAEAAQAAERDALIREAHDNKQRARAFERDAARYRKLQALATKKTAHDVYGNGCLWTVGLHCDDSRLSFADAVDAAPAVGGA